MNTNSFIWDDNLTPYGGTLSKETLLSMIKSSAPLIENFQDIDLQLQPNGFDMTLQTIAKFTTQGKLESGDQAATISQIEELHFDTTGCIYLKEGCYLATINEIVSLPLNIMALARPRSTLLRSGVSIHSAVWDAGYRGRSQTLLTVYNPLGYTIAKDSRIMQMVFFHLSQSTQEGYTGRYQRENLD